MEDDPERPYDGGNTTGFVSPAGDALEGAIDLSAVLDLRRPHRYLVRVTGDGLRHRGIHDGDVLVVCTATAPSRGKVVVAMIGGDVVIAALSRLRGSEGWCLRSDARQAELPIRPDDEIWGVATGLVRTEV